MSRVVDSPEIKMYFVTHKDVKAYVFLNENKALEFIKKNKHIWDKYDIESDDFEVKEALVADKDLSKLYQENLPEYLV